MTLYGYDIVDLVHNFIYFELHHAVEAIFQYSH